MACLYNRNYIFRNRPSRSAPCVRRTGSRDEKHHRNQPSPSAPKAAPGASPEPRLDDQPFCQGQRIVVTRDAEECVSLPTEVDPSASEVRFENGPLTLTLAKKVPSGATQLTVN